MSGGPTTDTLPLAAGEGYRLPPLTQILFTPTVVITLIVLIAAIIAIAYMSHRAKLRKREEDRAEALRMAGKIILKRGGAEEDAEAVNRLFAENPGIDPGEVIMLRDKFCDLFLPLATASQGVEFRERLLALFFHPIKKPRSVSTIFDQPTTESGKVVL